MARSTDTKDGTTIWVSSNRVDDRVVLFEKSPEHPGGEAFVGGGKVDCVARTGAVEGLLRAGLLVEIPEPPESTRKPVVTNEGAADGATDMPGQRIRLGRVMDPVLVPNSASVAAAQKELPAQIDSTATAPGA